ncbi:MAG: hypothetical protein RL264_2954 [Bacteroidota bacterium]|jgi:hypothetical protein
MKVDKIYLKAGSKFSERVYEWSVSRCNDLVSVQDKLADAYETFDSLLIFNENQTLNREISELKTIFDKQQRPVHKIDINGTLMVGRSNLELWVEQAKCKRLLVIGGDELVKNPNLERFIG